MSISLFFFIFSIRTSSSFNLNHETFINDLSQNFEENVYMIHKKMLLMINDIIKIQANKNSNDKLKDEGIQMYSDWLSDMKEKIQYTNMIKYLNQKCDNSFCLFLYKNGENKNIDGYKDLSDYKFNLPDKHLEAFYNIFNLQKEYLTAFIFYSSDYLYEKKLDTSDFASKMNNLSIICRYLDLLEKTFKIDKKTNESICNFIKTNKKFELELLNLLEKTYVYLYKITNIEESSKNVNLFIFYKSLNSNIFQLKHEPDFSRHRTDTAITFYFYRQISDKFTIFSELSTYKKILHRINNELFEAEMFLNEKSTEQVEKLNIQEFITICETDYNKPILLEKKDDLHYNLQNANTQLNFYCFFSELNNLSNEMNQFINVSLENVCLEKKIAFCKNVSNFLKEYAIFIKKEDKKRLQYLKNKVNTNSNLLVWDEKSLLYQKYIKKYKKVNIFLNILHAVDVLRKKVKENISLLKMKIKENIENDHIQPETKKIMNDYIFNINADLTQIHILIIDYEIVSS